MRVPDKLISDTSPLKLKHDYAPLFWAVVCIALFMFTLLLALLLPNSAKASDERVVKSLLEMRKERVVIQEWDLSCGAAALSTLMTYQLQNPKSEKMIAEALIKRKEYIEHPELIQIMEGFSLLDLKRYVDNQGYEGIGLGKLEFADLEQYAPIMIPIKVLGYNHFVIFRGSLANRVLLADPAWGNRTMLIQTFTDAWIDYPQFGKVGFVVAQKNGVSLPNHLAPKPEDFVFLR